MSELLQETPLATEEVEELESTAETEPGTEPAVPEAPPRILSPLEAMMEQLCRVAEEQVLAARSMKISRMEELNQEYTDLCFDLEILMQEGLPEDEEILDFLRTQRDRLMRSQERLGHITGTMIGITEQVLPKRDPQTYDRRGRFT